MSEGRTPTATITEQRRLEQEDVDVLHQIVIRAQNDPISQESPKDALLEAYREIFNERKLSSDRDRACFNVLLKLLDPATPGESLYHKFENVLQEEGIVLTYDDDATTHDEPAEFSDEHVNGHAANKRQHDVAIREMKSPQRYSTNALEKHEHFDEAQDDVYLEEIPLYISDLYRQAEARDRAVLAKQTLEAWKSAVQAAEERELEARADVLYRLRLKRKVLKQCLAVFQDLRNSQIQADQIYCRKLARNVLGRTSDEYRVRRMNSMDEDRMKALSLYKWTLASREAAFKRGKDWEVKRLFYHKLVDSFRATQIKEEQLGQILHHNDARLQSTVLRGVMLMFSQKANKAVEHATLADEQNRTGLYQASLHTWRSKLGKLTDLTLTAEDAREYFLMKRVLRKLRFLTQFRKERHIWLATWATRKWLGFVKARKHARYDETYRQMRRTVKVNLARKLLYHWRRKLHGLRADDTRADQVYQQSLMGRINRPVVEMLYDTAQWVSKHNPVAEKEADQFLQKRALLAMQMKQQSLVDMSMRAERLCQYRTEQRAIQSVRQVQLKAFELQRRQSDADAFRNRCEKRAVRNALARLRHTLAERRVGDEGVLALVPPPAVTPAKKREELLLHSSTRLSTTPAYTPFAMRLRQEPRVLEDIEDDEDDDNEEEMDDDEHHTILMNS